MATLTLFKSTSYDFIFCGTGCAALSLLTRMIRSGRFSDQRILLIDREPKTRNDRTWCFWEQGAGYFDHLVHHRWDRVAILGDNYNEVLDISPYQYKLIRGIDFYKYCFELIASQSNIEVFYGDLQDWYEDVAGLTFHFASGEVHLPPATVFNSIYKPAPPDKKSLRLLQHFKGWMIETPEDRFDPAVATMMDFRIPQDKGTSFVYVLPITRRSALVEYTLFTRSVLAPEEYDRELSTYLNQWLGVHDYSIAEEEFGIIPMTNEKHKFRGHGWQIGTAGGQTKGSSGYTFQFIQKQSDRILVQLLAGKSLAALDFTAPRFRFYDNTLLYILYHNKLPGHSIFTRLFQRNKAASVLKFLDNETNLWEEIKIIGSLPTAPFLHAALASL